jgi:hypothetical protein
MPTTTNYGWTTPADTDLVKDGAAAIRTLGSSIDTTVFANASAGIPKTIVDAKGDLIAGTASDTVSRLAVGTNGQVLTADSAEATGMKWGTIAAGGMTLLSTTTLSGTTTDITSISGSYKDLIFIVSGETHNTGTAEIELLPNLSATITNWIRLKGTQIDSTTANYIRPEIGMPSSNASNSMCIVIKNYANTSYFKPFTVFGCINNTSFSIDGHLITTSAITSMRFRNNSNYTFTGGQVLIYGAS